MVNPSDEFTHIQGDGPGNLFTRLPALPLVPATTLAALVPPEPPLLGPLAPGTITLIRGPRGAGKSWLALAMAHAVASDAGLLGWRARPAPVVHVEAAMGRAAVGARLRALGSGAARLRIVCDCPLDPGDATDQARIMEALPEGGLLVLDGLSLLMPAGRGAAARWQSLCDWLRLLRQEGHAVLLVDHASRPAVAALADTLVTIKPSHEEGAVAFTVGIASRHALRPADRAFAARLDLADGTARWARDAIADPALRAVAEAAREGGTVRDIAAALGLAPATAWRRLNRAKALGLVADGKAGETGETAFAPLPREREGPARASEREGEGPRCRPCTSVRDGRCGESSPHRPLRGHPLPRERVTGADDKPRETGETAGTAVPPAGLANISTEVLQRTLARRLKAHREGQAGDGPRAGPALLAGFEDAALVAECTRRLKPPRAARLLREFAPLQQAV
jgi:AAA domain